MHTVIPDYAKLRYIVRAPTWPELEVLRERVMACFKYAYLSPLVREAINVSRQRCCTRDVVQNPSDRRRRLL